VKSLKEKQEELVKAKETLKAKKDKLIEIYSDGIITKQQLQSKMEEYSKKEREIEEKLREIKARIDQVELRPLLEKHIKQLCEIAKKRLESLNFEEKSSFYSS